MRCCWWTPKTLISWTRTSEHWQKITALCLVGHTFLSVATFGNWNQLQEILSALICTLTKNGSHPQTAMCCWLASIGSRMTQNGGRHCKELGMMSTPSMTLMQLTNASLVQRGQFLKMQLAVFMEMQTERQLMLEPLAMHLRHAGKHLRLCPRTC